MVPLASGVGKVIGCFVVERIIPRNGSELQNLHTVSSRHQVVHAVLLQLQNDLRIPIRFAQPQECLNAVVAGHPNPQTTIHGVVAFDQHNLTGGHAATSNQAGGVSVVEQAGNLKGIMVAHIAAAGIGIRHRHHHPMVCSYHLFSHPGSQGIRC